MMKGRFPRFKPKSTFNPRNKDAVIETYLSCLGERLIDIEIPSKRFNNLTKDKRNAMYSLKDDKSIIIKGVNKGAAVIVWDREDYIKEESKKLEDKEVYMEVPNDSSAPVSTIFKSLEKITKRGELPQDTLNYFLVKDAKFARFYLLPEIHKRLYGIPGRPVISNCGFYTENISSQVTNQITKDTNHFLRKIKELGQLPEGTILCTINVVGLYPNIPHDEGLAFLKDFMDSRVDKLVTTDTLIELAELVFQNSIFEFSDKTYKQIRGTTTGTKFALPYAVLFMAALEEEILRKVRKKPSVWWRYIDDIFFICEHGEESLKEFINEINSFHPTIKFTGDWSKEKINFLDVEVNLKNGVLSTDLSVKPTDTHQFLDPISCHPYHCKNGIPCSQTLTLNRICSDNSNFDKRCNELEGWLFEKGYSVKMVRKRVLRAREHSRESLLEKVKSESEQKKLTFNITYYPVFQNVRNILQELHILLTPGQEHNRVFQDIPAVGFRKW